jgi:hypothetical protein
LPRAVGPRTRTAWNQRPPVLFQIRRSDRGSATGRAALWRSSGGLSCRYFVRGDVPTGAKLAQNRLRDRGYSIQVVSLPPDAPTSWLVNGLQPERHVSVGLVSPGDPLNWQLGSLTVPSGYVGHYVRVSERE